MWVVWKAFLSSELPRTVPMTPCSMGPQRQKQGPEFGVLDVKNIGV